MSEQPHEIKAEYDALSLTLTARERQSVALMLVDALAPLGREFSSMDAARIIEGRLGRMLADRAAAALTEVREARIQASPERVGEVAEVLNEMIVAHSMWIGDDGLPLDYLPERESRIGDFVREASQALAPLVAQP